MLQTRTSGMLLSVASLPSAYGIGDLGPEARRFVDFLASSRQTVWQVLPLNPTLAERSHSPYEPSSAFAGNPLLISPDVLAEEGWLSPEELDAARFPPSERIDFPAVSDAKDRLFHKAYLRFSSRIPEEYHRFCERERAWLDTAALFLALRQNLPREQWWTWAVPEMNRDTNALEAARHQLESAIEREKFLQFCFRNQWDGLKRYANQRGLQLFGDIPFYVGRESADVWGEPENFQLDEAKEPLGVAGVPPDRFSETGQLWGNPLYDWHRQRESGYDWWMRRLGMNFSLFDGVRIDHFRGLAEYYRIPAGSATAAEGEWVDGPGRSFLDRLYRHFPFAPLFAENLGTVTPALRDLMQAYALPGMVVMQFGFDGDPAQNENAPHLHTPNCVLYSGTHDNNTLRGWLEEETDDHTKHRLRECLGHDVTPDTVSWDLIRLCMMSPCRILIVPVQDILARGADARMNCPGRAESSWQWRMLPDALNGEHADPMARLIHLFGR